MKAESSDERLCCERPNEGRPRILRWGNARSGTAVERDIVDIVSEARSGGQKGVES